MPILQAHNISYQFENGEKLFDNLSCSMTQRRVGLVGRNGAGKSILASILSGEKTPSSGTVTQTKSVLAYRQQASDLLAMPLSLSQFLGKHDVLEALKRVEAGDCSQYYFDVIGDQWTLSKQLNQQLKALGLPQQADFPCAQLSGGQLARLQLWNMFESDAEMLFLDEPSNHLDVRAKEWLLGSMREFKGAIFLISHDRTLLREMEEIWEISELGLQVFGGNYDIYHQRKHAEIRAVERQLISVDKQRKHLRAQIQCNREKAEQRAAQGNRLRKEGSQAKMILDGAKNQAEVSASKRNKNQQHRQMKLDDKHQALMARKELLKEQKLYLEDGACRSGKVMLSILNGVLAYGYSNVFSLQVYANEKVHLAGPNGCGKSTLLKMLAGKKPLKRGECRVNAPLCMLDQHFGMIQSELSMLDNLLQQCCGITVSEARTLLAGIGFRRDSVFRLGRVLSGGEKMKLAMLIVSHQPEQPFLLLDEPDNHLDLESKIILAQALLKYRGGYILISHDHDFVTESGVQRTIRPFG